MGISSNKCRQFPTRIHQHNVKGIYKFHPQVNTPPVADNDTGTEIHDPKNTGLI